MPNGSGQLIGNSVAVASAKNDRLAVLSDLAEEHGVVPEQWIDPRLEVLEVERVDLGCDVERPAAAAGDVDRRVEALLGADTADEDEMITLRARLLQVRAQVEAVGHRVQPVEAQSIERPTLGIADRDERKVGVHAEHRPQHRQVETPVHRRHRRYR